MYKKTLLSATIASVLTLTGCLDSGKTENFNKNTGPGVLPASAIGTYPIFDPAVSKLPIPIDLIFDKVAKDGTFSVPNSPPNPVTTALNSLSGASTVAPIDIKISGLINETTVANNVFLIALDYASGSPVQGLSIGEPPTITLAKQPSIKASTITLDGTSYIRLNPIKPLNPLTRYVVVITNGVKDINGDPLQQSPGVTGYKTLTNAQQGLADPALAPVRALINGLWEPTAVKFFNAAVNPARATGGLPALTDGNIALSYSFTTSGDKKVLSYIADPGTWFADQITNFVGVKTATSIVKNKTDVDSNGVVDFKDISLAFSGALTAFPANPSNPSDTTISDALAPLKAAFPAFGCTGVTSGPDFIKCIGTVLSNLPSSSGGFADILPTPAPKSIDFSTNTAPTSDLYSLLAGVNPLINAGYNQAGFPGFTAPGNYQVKQGTITVPYYSGLPTDSTLGPLALKFASWKADEELATHINKTFFSIGLSLPQGRTVNPAMDFSVTPPTFADFTVAPKSSVVNYIYPFPKKQDGDTVTAGTQDVTIPIIAMYPTTHTSPMKTVIWGHGLKGKRSDVLPFGAGVIGASKAQGVDVAVIAFDEPLHGVVGTTTAFHTANERHFELGNAGAGLSKPPLDINIVCAAAKQCSGSMFVNIESFLTSRDNLRQHVLDLFTVRKSLATVDFENDSTKDLDGSDVYYMGHSLGTIDAQAFVAVANSTKTNTDDITAAAFFTPGGGISRFFDNSPTFTPDIVNGLGPLGFTSNTSSYQAFLNVLQGTLDAVDAINFVGDYATQNTPVLFVEAIDDLVIPISQKSSDRTLQASANSALGNLYDIAGSVSYLSGSEPLALEAGATAIKTAGTVPLKRSLIRYKSGAADHCTPSVPGLPAFNENLGQAVSMVLTGKLAGGPFVTLVDDTLVETTMPLPLPPTTGSGCPLSFPPAP